MVGVLQRDIRGERSGLDDSYLRTWFIQNEFKVNQKLNVLSRVIYRETGTGDDSYIYVTADGNKMLRIPITTYSNRIAGEISANYIFIRET